MRRVHHSWRSRWAKVWWPRDSTWTWYCWLFGCRIAMCLSGAGIWFRFLRHAHGHRRKVMKENHANTWLALGVLLALGCEASTPLDSENGGSVGASSSQTGGAGGAGATAGGSGGAGATGDAGPSCSMSASQYDNSCNVDSDCVGVPEGQPCAGNCLSICYTAALNARVAYQYLADFRALMPADETIVCHCPCITAPYCCRGVCYDACGDCSTTP